MYSASGWKACAVMQHADRQGRRQSGGHLEGLEEEAKQFTGFFAAQGADQCGFCNPGYIVNIVALLRENPDPTDEEILEYLSGNLCRCTGYQSQLRSIRNFLNSKNEGAPLNLEAGVYGEDIGKEWKDEHKSN